MSSHRVMDTEQVWRTDTQLCCNVSRICIHRTDSASPFLPDFLRCPEAKDIFVLVELRVRRNHMKKMINTTIATALLLLAASPVPGYSITAATITGDTYPRQTGFRVANYSFTVLLSDASNELVITDSVDLNFTAAGVTAMDLDLCQLRTAAEPANPSNPCLVPAVRTRPGEPAAAPVSSVGRGMVVTSVTSGGQALKYSQAHDRLHIVFPAASKVGGRLSFTVAYHGVPATGILIANNKYGDRSFVSNPWPDKTRNWLAVVDHPYMKAPKEIAVTAPAKYQIISNGTKIESTDLPNGLRRTVWKESVT